MANVHLGLVEAGKQSSTYTVSMTTMANTFVYLAQFLNGKPFSKPLVLTVEVKNMVFRAGNLLVRTRHVLAVLRGSIHCTTALMSNSEFYHFHCVPKEDVEGDAFYFCLAVILSSLAI